MSQSVFQVHLQGCALGLVHRSECLSLFSPRKHLTLTITFTSFCCCSWLFCSFLPYPPPFFLLLLLLFLFPFFLLFFFLAPGDPPWLHNQQFSFHKSVSFHQYACTRIFKAILVIIGKTWNNADAHQHRMGKLLTVYS